MFQTTSWERLLTASYLINRISSWVIEFHTPRQVWCFKSFTSTKIISPLDPKIFGYSAFVHINQQRHNKLNHKSTKCIFLDYSPYQKGYKCYCPNNKKSGYLNACKIFEYQPYYSKSDIRGEAGESIIFRTFLMIHLTQNNTTIWKPYHPWPIHNTTSCSWSTCKYSIS